MAASVEVVEPSGDAPFDGDGIVAWIRLAIAATAMPQRRQAAFALSRERPLLAHRGWP